MTQLWLIRHGQTDWNVEGRWQGHADPPLNETGRAQARALAAELSGRKFNAIYSSDLRRSRETAEIIGERLGLPARLDARLREIDQGKWEGWLASEVAARYPDELAARRRDRVGGRAPGGESVAEVAARVGAVADELARAHLNGAVIVVSHGLSLATLLCRVRGLPLQQARELIPDNARPEVVAWPPWSGAPAFG